MTLSNKFGTRIAAFCLFVFALFFAVACSDDEPASLPSETEGTPCRIAVVLPLDETHKPVWENTVELAVENILRAQSGLEKRVCPEVEWYDENTENISQLMETLAKRTDLNAIVGPYHSAHSQEAAYQCAKTDKTLFTLSTSAELIRVFSQKHNFLWALSETDISQCEVLLSKALYYHGKSVSLLANDDIYGQTFIDWFAFQAKELGLEARGVHLLGDNPQKACREAFADGSDFILVAASAFSEVEAVLEASKGESTGTTRLLFSDTAFSTELQSDGFAFRPSMIEGVAVSPDPNTGFATLYESRFGKSPSNGVPQLYDALMMTAYAAFLLEQGICTDMNEALKQLVDGREACQANWRAEGMARVFAALAQGGSPDIEGCTGNLEFDTMVYTNVLHSTYANWLAYDGTVTVLGHTGSNGGNRVDPTLAGWNWVNTVQQEFENESTGIAYPALNDCYAVLVAASTKWSNYRHQADILAIYQQLKLAGYDDDHIVLIMEDDLANHPNNPYPGQIFVTDGGENVYRNVKIDYKLSDLRPNDLIDILTGCASHRLPHVVKAGEQDNVFLFWSGHGVPGALCWDEESQGLTTDMASRLFRTMHERKCYRKLIGFIETCYSGSVLKATEGIPGMLFFTAANELETSKADMFSYDMLTYLSNRFTRIFIERITADKNIALRDLYLDMFRNTLGSHVMIYNAPNFDNIYKCTMQEFMNFK